jgi:heparanase 1
MSLVAFPGARSRCALLCLAASACSAAPGSRAERHVQIDVDRAAAEASARFLSFSIDASNVGRPYDFSRPRLRRMAAELAPAYLRIGGTASDTIYYDLSEAPVTVAPPPYARVLDRGWWDQACSFARDLELEILFTLNVGPGPRDAMGRWTPDNARRLIEYTLAQGCPVGVWELGNEINAFPLLHGFSLDGQAYAADMAVARKLIDELDPAALLAGPAIAYWPLWGEVLPTMQDFLSSGGNLIDVLTWHYYPQQSAECPVASRRAAPETMLDPANLDEVQRWAGEVEGLRDDASPGTPVWLGETGHAQCGGEVGLSDRFVTGFWWLDQLGLMARRGQPVVVRQALTGGRYHLIDNASLEPRPDYFNSLLWKRLMGRRALHARTIEEDGLLRVHAHCAPEGPRAPGAVTALLINLDSRETWVGFPDLPGRRELYLLTAPDLLGTRIDLHGVPLEVLPDGAPPALAPEIVDDPIRLPPKSYAFVVLPDALAPACGAASRAARHD